MFRLGLALRQRVHAVTDLLHRRYEPPTDLSDLSIDLDDDDAD